MTVLVKKEFHPFHRNTHLITAIRKHKITSARPLLGKSCMVSSPLLVAFCSSELLITGGREIVLGRYNYVNIQRC